MWRTLGDGCTKYSRCKLLTIACGSEPQSVLRQGVMITTTWPTFDQI